MTIYAIVQLKITDRKSYDLYQAKFWNVFKQYNGQLLVSDEEPKVFEGEWHNDKMVVISFPNEEAFTDWATSPEYLEIVQHRYAGATASIVLANGFSLEKPTQ